MHVTKFYKIIVGLTLLVVLFLPNFTYANSESESFYHKGHVYLNQRQYNLAIDEYTKAIALDPQYGKAYNNRGLAYYRNLQYDLALSDYNKAIALIPNEDFYLHFSKSKKIYSIIYLTLF